MNELIAKIKELNEAFMSDAALQIEKGNKAAGTRARKASLELGKLMKEFRKAFQLLSNLLFVFLKIFISHPSGWLSLFSTKFCFYFGGIIDIFVFLLVGG